MPPFVYLTLPNDHTNGVTPGKPTPKALIADNDLGLGQIVQLISHSSIWSTSAIFVVEDDSQDGADHVDAHRMPAFVISPYARAGAVVRTRYDQYSAIRTIELILGMPPLSLFDALATPMYDAFTTQPDLTPYDAIQPTQPLDERNPLSAPTVFTSLVSGSAALTPAGADAQQLALALPFSQVDLVPQALSDAVAQRVRMGFDATATGTRSVVRREQPSRGRVGRVSPSRQHCQGARSGEHTRRRG